MHAGVFGVVPEALGMIQEVRIRLNRTATDTAAQLIQLRQTELFRFVYTRVFARAKSIPFSMVDDTSTSNFPFERHDALFE